MVEKENNGSFVKIPNWAIITIITALLSTGGAWVKLSYTEERVIKSEKQLAQDHDDLISIKEKINNIDSKVTAVFRILRKDNSIGE